ncbi:hypothetical protein M3Y98_00872800 [Aphelenchoides besseyi]|nr:hypothetical protein M3Y98_00872800 [Aphelenchoides besseyi]KAI6211301.1 hypothetical protein M3Y96_00419100 [Aphelenchoides besseyi]
MALEPLEVTTSWTKVYLLISTFFVLNHPTSGFQVLPYVHIDYEHYYRLAQCQAQCTEKYATVQHRRRLDGSIRASFNVSNSLYSQCQTGCANARVSTKRAHSRSVSDAFKDGQLFWQKAAEPPPPVGQRRGPTTSATSTVLTERSPISTLKLLCLKPASTSSTPGDSVGYLDGYEALATAIPHKIEFLAPVRYLIQWKQRVPLGKDSQFDETKWITAAIESDLTFTIEGIQPGVQYRFMITVIGTTGRLGSGVLSEWIEAPPLGSGMSTIAMPMIITPQYNSDDNVSAVVSFRRPIDTPLNNARRFIPPTCVYHLRFINVSQTVHTADFEMDESEGYLLTNLAFSTDYEVQLLPRLMTSNGPAGNLVTIGNSVENRVVESTVSPVFTSRFKTISCSDVFGAGSLQCDPEPVQDLDIRISTENSTVIVSWRPSVEARHVLLYELLYEPVADYKEECGLEETTLYLTAKATQVELAIPPESTHCEVEVHLTNYDLRGREASITARFVYRAPAVPNTFVGFDTSDISSNLWIVVLVPVIVVIALVLLLRYASAGQRKLKKVVKPGTGTVAQDPLVPKSQRIPQPAPSVAV